MERTLSRATYGHWKPICSPAHGTTENNRGENVAPDWMAGCFEAHPSALSADGKYFTIIHALPRARPSEIKNRFYKHCHNYWKEGTNVTRRWKNESWNSVCGICKTTRKEHAQRRKEMTAKSAKIGSRPNHSDGDGILRAWKGGWSFSHLWDTYCCRHAIFTHRKHSRCVVCGTISGAWVLIIICYQTGKANGDGMESRCEIKIVSASLISRDEK